MNAWFNAYVALGPEVMAMEKQDLLSLTAHIVSAYVEKNSIPSGTISDVIASVSDAVSTLSVGQGAPTSPVKEPAVNPKKSIQPDHMVCLDCGKTFKSIKRHIGKAHGLTPAEYRKRWLLEASYPMVAPRYAAERSRIAKKMGLGRKPKRSQKKSAYATAKRGNPEGRM